ncbi:MAG: Uma2 family endonuclease [Thiohalocapsa sp.]|nr:Uma2 family endonuclease [Thiohalocapsa sp.]
MRERIARLEDHRPTPERGSRPSPRPRVSVAEYHAMLALGALDEHDLELIDGRVLGRPLDTDRHHRCLLHAERLLVAAIGDDAVARLRAPVVLGDYSVPVPDLTLVRPRVDSYADSYPRAGDVLCVIEAADATLFADLKIKGALYAQHGIPEYWVIDVTDCEVIRLAQPDEGWYRYRGHLDLSLPQAVPGLPDRILDFSTLFPGT